MDTHTRNLITVNDQLNGCVYRITEQLKLILEAAQYTTKIPNLGFKDLDSGPDYMILIKPQVPI